MSPSHWAPAEPLLCELRTDGGVSPLTPSSDTHAIERFLPENLRRHNPPAIPAIPEPILARHFGRLARRNHNLHEGMYPLGSCSMKYNPSVNEEIAGMPGFADLHPDQSDDDAQGTLSILFELEELLTEITGMARVSLQPAAGAHGEWTGLRMIQSYHRSRGDTHRRVVLVPDSAHGTNPASATLCGYRVVTVTSTPRGTVDVDDLRRHLSPEVAAIMLTNPNTFGVFEDDIDTIASLAHEHGALLYYDGANLNALVGKVRPGDMGFDVVHLNLHKTFSTPHGGGGPGAGPVGVSSALVPFLPTPTIEEDGGRYWLDYDNDKSIGPVRSYVGNVAVLIRAWAYIRTLGSQLSSVANDAVLNARYLLSQIDDLFEPAVPGPTLHEFVVSPRVGDSHALRASDIAKGLLDHSLYAPTIYFPITVKEAMMFEPTETESKDSIDHLAHALRDIVEAAKSDPEWKSKLPQYTPLRRVDEVKAARTPILTWKAWAESVAKSPSGQES